MIYSYGSEVDFPWSCDAAVYGVHINYHRVEQLFERYREAGFLYEKKLDRLAPYWTMIETNWRKMLASKPSPLLHQVLMTDGTESGSWSTGAIWLTRPNVVQSHHLASNGNPLASRQVFLAGQARCWAAGAQYVETWYRAENRFPNRFFGGCATFLGTARAQIDDIALVALPKSTPYPLDASVVVSPCTSADVPDLLKLLERQMGRFLATAECLDPEDIYMTSVDAVYQSVGLRRYRDVLVARDRISGAILGVALAYRGPLGTNFSFTENVCRMVVAKGVVNARRSRVLFGLAQAALSTYETFELPYIIVGCDPAESRVIIEGGGTPLQTYRRLVWNRAGFADWYRYVGEVYERVTNRARDADREAA
jgi:hypothetical protein